MAKRTRAVPSLPDEDEGMQHQQHALTHEDGDAETHGAQASAFDNESEGQSHEARQSVARDAQIAHAQAQSDPAWLGASSPKAGKAKRVAKDLAGGHGYAPEIAHGEESGYGPADAAPGDHPRFGRQSAYGPHDDYAGTGRDTAGQVPPGSSPSQARRVEWPEGTVGADTAQQHAKAEPRSAGQAGQAGQATGSRGRSGGQGRVSGTAAQVSGASGAPQQTAHASVQARSRGPSPTDVAVREQVRAALRDAHDLDVSHVDVTVTSGMTLLTGHVPERWMQHVVQTVVSKVPGVRGVDNQLHERRGKAMSRPGESQEGHKI